MSVCNRVCGTRLNTIAAKDAAVVIDVVDLRVPLGAGNTVLCGVLRRFDVNAIRRAGSAAEEARYAFFQPVLLALQHVRAAIPLLEFRAAQRTRAVGIVLDDSRRQ